MENKMEITVTGFIYWGSNEIRLAYFGGSVA